MHLPISKELKNSFIFQTHPDRRDITFEKGLRTVQFITRIVSKILHVTKDTLPNTAAKASVLNERVSGFK
jgi:hypothetical protein